MKTFITFSFLLALITSCKKDYVCTCTTPGLIYNTPSTVEKHSIHATERAAKKRCQKYDHQDSGWFSSTQCELH